MHALCNAIQLTDVWHCDGDGRALCGEKIAKGFLRQLGFTVSLKQTYGEVGLELLGLDCRKDFDVGVSIYLGGVYSHEAGGLVYKQGSEPITIGGGELHGTYHVG